MKYLSPFEFESVQGYFKAFIELNSQNKSANNFSIRKFAAEINWPISYLNDLVSGRKNLTCLRAVEFGEFIKFSPHEIEYLIFLGIKGGLPDKHLDFFSKKVLGKKSCKRIINTEYSDFVYDVNAQVVYDVITWGKGKLTAEKISELLSTFDISVSEVNSIVEKLINVKLVEQKGHKIIAKNSDFIALDEMSCPVNKVQMHEDYAKSFIKFCNNPKGPALFYSGFLEIPRARFDEISDKIVALRNYLIEVSLETGKKENEQLAENLVFQFDFNLFPVVDKKVAEKIT